MQYDFDDIPDREKSGSVKWDLRESHGGLDIIPMWVADMDFRSPDTVINAIVNRARHGIYGYTYVSDSYKYALIKWKKKRNKWDIKEEWIVTTPGVVPALAVALKAFTKPGDKIVIQPPVYHPFKNVIAINDRIIVENRLLHSDGYYTMDYENLEDILKKGAPMIVLCSPHNPVGRVWKTEELQRLGEICLKYNTLIVSDEIHSDLLLPGHGHSVMAEISPEIRERTVTFTAASKTFNLAGLACSNIIISNRLLREAFQKVITSLSIGTPNIFGLVATEAAYCSGEEWLDKLLMYISDNYGLLRTFINENIPRIKVTELEGTYLAWLDFSDFGIPDKSLDDLLIKKAKVWLDNGPQFGPGGEGFQRINLACPRGLLQQALFRMEKTFN